MASQAVPFLNAVDSLTRSEQVRLGIRIMLLLGLRISEVTGMRWYWFSSDFKSYTPGLTKGKEADALPVPESLANRFRDYKEQTRKHWLLMGRPMPQCVFWTDEGNDRSPSFVASTISNAAKAIGLEGAWRPHRLGGDGLVDRSGKPPVTQVPPQCLTGRRGGIGLDFHGRLLGYTGWRIKNESQPTYETLPGAL